MSTQITEWLEVVAKILLRCWIFGLLLNLIWAVVFMFAGGVIHDLHGSMFGLSPHELNVINYCGMGLTKFAVGVFFFFPWLSIRLVLKKRKA